MAKKQKWYFQKDNTCLSGVVKIAEKVKNDIFLVTGDRPNDYECYEDNGNLIIYGTVGNSGLLDEYCSDGIIDLEKIRGKREVYGFFVIDHPRENVEQAIIIAGSDKRGTIYGLFHLSELLGVSPLVDWNHVMPKHHDFNVSEQDSVISKEPSVRYRGFFINDEWPAFGNWANDHFGGINAECYEKIFELLLRLKGNYLWPAMWKSNFNLDGPGLKSAILADEYGIVMSTSHHEPCMRAGEEFNYYKERVKDYGNDWNFITNRDGIVKFWTDGLIRNREFENVITMGMRGERDSAILGNDATLKDNIDLLKDVIRTQNKLIVKNVNENLNEVPRQIVLFTEVEEFFYGNEETEGLINDPELDGITLMLSDNNFGYTRTLPSKNLRNRIGGFGMYYHMDMHGGAYSYQWIGSTYLPRVWEQMTQAYEYGVREIWVANIGDIGTQEFGLSFFLDLAYDIEKWGGQECSVTEEYSKEWVERQFPHFDEDDRKCIDELIWGYTELLEKRKHEIMNADVYHPVNYGEAQYVLEKSENLLKEANNLKSKCDDENLSAFISLIYYPVCGTANLMKMWILAGRNRLYAKQNRIEANRLAIDIDKCLKEDSLLIDEYETIDKGYYKGFGKSLHIGFTNWNDEDCKLPVRHIIYPASEPRMLVTRPDSEEYSTGLYWCDNKLVWTDFTRKDVNYIDFCLVNGSDIPYYYAIVNSNEILSFSISGGQVVEREDIRLFLDKSKVKQCENLFFHVMSYADEKREILLADSIIEVCVSAQPNLNYTKGTFVEHDGYVAFPGKDFILKKDTEEGAFKIIEPYGINKSAVKVYPVTADFMDNNDPPYVEYSFVTIKEGEYNIRFYLAPTTPVCFERIQYMGFSVNNQNMVKINTVKNESIPFFLSEQWEKEAKDNVKTVERKIVCIKGENRLRFYGMSPGIVLEKVVIWDTNTSLKDSYLGPKISFCLN